MDVDLSSDWSWMFFNNPEGISFVFWTEIYDLTWKKYYSPRTILFSDQLSTIVISIQADEIMNRTNPLEFSE